MEQTIPASWEKKTLGDILDKGSSHIAANKLKDCDGEYPVWGASGLLKHVNFYEQDKEYIGIIKDGAGVGRANIYGPKSSLLGTMQYLFPKAGVNIRFAYYLLTTLNFEKYYQGAAIPHIYYKDYKQEEILLPPLAEQERIVKKLDDIMYKIDCMRANAEFTLSATEDLFESYLDKCFGHNENVEQLKLDDIAEITSSKRIYKNEYVSSGIPFYRTKEIKELAHNKTISLELFISQEKYNEIKDKFGVPLPNDLLISAVGTIGEIYVVQANDKFYFKDGNIIWFRKYKKQINVEYLKYCLTAFVKEIQNMTQGAAYNALTIEKLKEYKIDIIELEKQNKVVEVLKKIETQLNLLRQCYYQKLNLLEELRQSVLKQAFAGEL